MAERDLLSPIPPQFHDPTTTQTFPIFEAGTYVVQIPKDQIYRVPPPENSLIAQRHRNPERKKERACCSSFTCCFIVIAIFIILIALAIGLSFVLLKPKNPEFRIQNLLVKPIASKNSHSEYNFRLKINNPNGRSSIFFKEDGASTLYFEEHQIATGKFPTFLQDNGDVTDVAVVVKSSGGALPQEIKESMKRTYSPKKNGIALSLKMAIPVRMKVNSFTTGDTKLVVTCDFKVDKLSKGTRILAQECHSKRH